MIYSAGQSLYGMVGHEYNFIIIILAIGKLSMVFGRGRRFNFKQASSIDNP